VVVFLGALDRIVARAEARTNYSMEPIDPMAVSSDGQDTMTFILTVEDEEPLREYLGEILQDAGYSVIAAASADEAIAVLESRNDIRTVITDVNMPGSMDGLRLAAAVRGRWSPIRIIIATGKGAPGPGEMPPGSQFVPKPYRPDRILAAVRHA
jgi:two-component system, response regulator PdtaR